MNSENKNGLSGNQNAKKKEEDKKLSFIHARCSSHDKALWVKESQRRGVKLTEFIVNTLNKEIK